MKRAFAALAAAGFGAAISGCGPSVPTDAVAPASFAVAPPAATTKTVKIRTPALVVVTPNGILKYYRVRPNGGRDPIEIAHVPGIQIASSMAASGRVLAIADEGKPGAVLYDLVKQTARTLADPYGLPIDVAVGRNGDVYLLNQVGSLSSTVVRYPAGSRTAVNLPCKALVRGSAIALDDDGDVFVNGYNLKDAGVVEFPSFETGPQPGVCHRLPLLPEQGYAAGIAVDPKTNALIVVSDPGSCSGGIEGEMTIYPAPYRKRTARTVDLNGRCVGLVRLNASSSSIFALDRTSGFAHDYVIQRSYPQGSGDATYRHRYVGGFTTLPNALPN